MSNTINDVKNGDFKKRLFINKGGEILIKNEHQESRETTKYSKYNDPEDIVCLDKEHENVLEEYPRGSLSLQDMVLYHFPKEYNIFHEMFSRIRSHYTAVSEAYKGYYVIASPLMSLDCFLYAINKFVSESELDPEKVFFCTDTFSSNKNLFNFSEDRGFSIDTEDESLYPTNCEEYMKNEYIKAISSFEKVIVLLDSWLTPLTLLSPYCLWQIDLLIKSGKDFEIFSLKKLPAQETASKKNLSTKQEIFRLSAAYQNTLKLYPFIYGTGREREVNVVSSIYPRLETLAFEDLVAREKYLTPILKRIIIEDASFGGFSDMMKRVSNYFKKKLSKYLLTDIIPDIIRKSKTNFSLKKLEKLRSCAIFLYELSEIELAIGVMDYIEFNLLKDRIDNIEIIEFKVHLHLDKYQLTKDTESARKIPKVYKILRFVNIVFQKLYKRFFNYPDSETLIRKTFIKDLEQLSIEDINDAEKVTPILLGIIRKNSVRGFDDVKPDIERICRTVINIPPYIEIRSQYIVCLNGEATENDFKTFNELVKSFACLNEAKVCKQALKIMVCEIHSKQNLNMEFKGLELDKTEIDSCIAAEYILVDSDTELENSIPSEMFNIGSQNYQALASKIVE